MDKAGLLLLVLVGGSSGLAASFQADAQRGSDFFKTQGCVNCHAVQGQSKAKAPDLSQRFDRNYTPAGIAALMWNHAPVMWSTMAAQGITPPAVSAQQAADLFAFFYSARYFEKPGEAERGKRLFESKHCADCHAIASGGGPGKPVAQWQSLRDPVVLVESMWDHADLMKTEMANRKIQWPQLTTQDFSDLLVYLQNLPQTRNEEREFAMPAAETGEQLFESKGCTNCHKGQLALEKLLGDSTLTDVAVDLWDHSPQMQQPHPHLTLPEMREVLSYVWAKQFFGSTGDAVKGKKTFEAKKCAACHDNASSGAPTLTKPATPYSAVAMVEVLWHHGPAMERKMHDMHIGWPQLSQSDMANLIAYLNSR
ncbi:MAG TPA: c-type cytochrome [Bryobacteraceae bacterium]|nr:c-type cytochrome [Bryobacteraceae bacterium]